MVNELLNSLLKYAEDHNIQLNSERLKSYLVHNNISHAYTTEYDTLIHNFFTRTNSVYAYGEPVLYINKDFHRLGIVKGRHEKFTDIYYVWTSTHDIYDLAHVSHLYSIDNDNVFTILRIQKKDAETALSTCREMATKLLQTFPFTFSDNLYKKMEDSFTEVISENKCEPVFLNTYKAMIMQIIYNYLEEKYDEDFIEKIYYNIEQTIIDHIISAIEEYMGILKEAN